MIFKQNLDNIYFIESMGILGLLIFAMTVFSISCINFFNRIELTTKNGAMCLDGSPFGIYLYEPDEVSTAKQNNLLILLEQTDFGWCIEQDLPTSLEKCLKFMTDDALTDFGSSKQWPTNFLPLAGILSAAAPGEFASWTKVLIKSCDGGSYLGNRAPIDFKNKKINFRGGKNMEQAIYYLNSSKLLAKRDQIVFGGSFNSAIAAMLWWPRLKQFTGVSKFRLLLDSAIFLNEPNRKHNRNVIQNRMQMIEKLVITDDDLPNTACNTAHHDQKWKCLFAEELIKFTGPTPLYFTQSLYDGWAIREVLGYECAQVFASLSQCQKKERQVIDEYHKNVTSILKHAISLNEDNGGFGISCVAHSLIEGRYDNEMFEVPMNSNHTVSKVVGDWVASRGRGIAIDSMEWPSNVPCARKAATNLLKQ